MTEGRISSLCWVDEGENHPLQPWARFFLKLGTKLSIVEVPGGCGVTAAFALPVLDQCAVLAAVGLVTESAKIPVVAGANRERFEIMKRLPSGSAVTVLKKSKLYVGKIDTDSDLRGDETIPVLVSDVTKNPWDTSNGNGNVVEIKLTERILCRPSNCMMFEPTEAPTATEHRQRGLRIIEHPQFLTKALEAVPVERLCLGSRMDYALVGTRSRILADAESRMAIVEGPRKPAGGNAA